MPICYEKSMLHIDMGRVSSGRDNINHGQIDSLPKDFIDKNQLSILRHAGPLPS